MPGMQRQSVIATTACSRACSGWIYAACFRHSNTKNPELATLFARCCHLLRLPIYPVFVFDGPERPNVKRQKHVRGNCHWITVDMKEMLDCLGFPWIDVGAFPSMLSILD